MIDFHRLTYWYPEADRPALADLNLSVERGGLLVIAGRSGSGKSSLLWSVNGLIPHFYGGRYAGDVEVNGRSVRQTRPQDLAAMVGTVFQEPARRFVTRSTLDEIAFGLEIAGTEPAVMRRQVEAVVESLNIGGLLDRPLDHMSGGEQQRVALAGALARQPDLLVLDEPTSQLDRAGTAALLDWLNQRRRQGDGTTLVVEHRLEDLAQAATDAIYLDPDGRIGLHGDAFKVLADMPYGPPLVMTARRLGLPAGRDGVDELRRALQDVAGEAPQGHDRDSGNVVLVGKGLSASYAGAPAIRQVEVALAEGRVTAFLGENGSGKTTLVRALVGLMPLDGGEIWFEGRRLDSHAPARAGSVGYVPQWPSAMLFAESVREELAFTLAHREGPVVEGWGIDDMLARLELSTVAGRYPRDLSAGQRQRAALAAVLVGGPRVVLLDEPSLGMDPVAKSQLAGIVRALAGRGAALAVATHDVELAAQIADEVVVLRAGAVEAQGPTHATLFRSPDTQTSLQRLTERPWPATTEEAVQACEEFHKPIPYP